jgi:hypothetical protein
LREQIRREAVQNVSESFDPLLNDGEVSVGFYAQVCETLGFIGTLVGIIIAFQAIPLLQIPTSRDGAKSDVMIAITSGLVLAFGTTFLAQSCKLVISIIGRAYRARVADLKHDSLRAIDDYIVHKLTGSALRSDN